MAIIRDYLPNIISAIAILALGIPLTKFLNKTLTKILNRSKIDKTVTEFVSSLLNAATLFIVIILATSKLLNTDLSVLMATMGTIFIALIIVLKDGLSSALGGTVILSNRLFSIGDIIEINRLKGEVIKIKLLSTKIKTSQNKEITIPNYKLVNEHVISYKKESKVSFCIDYTLKDKTEFKAFMEQFNNEFLSKEPNYIEICENNTEGIKFKVHLFCSYKDYQSKVKRLQFFLEKAIFINTKGQEDGAK